MDMLYYINRLNEGEKMLTSEFARHERQKTKNVLAKVSERVAAAQL